MKNDTRHKKNVRYKKILTIAYKTTNEEQQLSRKR